MAKKTIKHTEKKDYYNDASTITGLHIYDDNKGHKVYYKPRKMIGYVIKNENVRSYRTYANRYMTAMAAMAILLILSKDWNMPFWICIVLGLGVWAILELRFHTSFLPNLVQLHNFIPKEKPSMLDAMALQDMWRLFSKIVLFPVFGVLLLILFQQRDADVYTFALGWVILVGTIIVSILNSLALVRKRKTKAV